MNEEKVIYKYILHPKTGRVVIGIHGGALAMSAGYQSDGVVIWAFVNPKADKLPCVFYQVFTGDPLPNAVVSFIATVQGYDGLVWHVFQEIR